MSQAADAGVLEPARRRIASYAGFSLFLAGFIASLPAELPDFATLTTLGVVAMLFGDRLAYLLTGSIDDATGRYVVAFAALFVITLITVGLVARLLQSLIAFAGLGFLDRLLGMGFGFARGVFVLLAAVVMLRPLLQPERFLWWQQSVLLPHLLLMEGWFRSITGAAGNVLSGIAN
jgi:membrane protein required for colicin V production